MWDNARGKLHELNRCCGGDDDLVFNQRYRSEIRYVITLGFRYALQPGASTSRGACYGHIPNQPVYLEVADRHDGGDLPEASTRTIEATAVSDSRFISGFILGISRDRSLSAFAAADVVVGGPFGEVSAFRRIYDIDFSRLWPTSSGTTMPLLSHDLFHDLLRGTALVPTDINLSRNLSYYDVAAGVRTAGFKIGNCFLHFFKDSAPLISR